VKTDIQLYRDVIDEFEWDAQLRPNEIGISVIEGVVILMGCLESHSKRGVAEHIAKRVAGVKAVVNEIRVRRPSSSDCTDADIARTAVHVLAQRVTPTPDRVKVLVHEGWVTLEGDVDRYDQCEDVEEEVHGLLGVIAVTNLIIVKPAISAAGVKAQISKAFKRYAELAAQHISVETQAGRVVLRGRLGSWVERADAESAARDTPGVTNVENAIEVAP
jgi:osmotically-inducible protein OsmY